MPAALGVALVAPEHPVVEVAIALGDQQAARLTGHGALEEVRVGLLAGLEDSEFGVDGTVGGDQPRGRWFGTGEDAGGVVA